MERHENEWPLARTQWTKYYLDAETHTLSTASQSVDSAASYACFDDGVTFMTAPLEDELEITGPIASKLWVSSQTTNADLFVVVRAFTSDLQEIVFQGALDPCTPIAQGWLRVSHRKLDPDLTLPHRPYLTHDEEQPMTPGEVYEVDIEIWPTCIVLEPGTRLAVTVRGKDYVYPGKSSINLGMYENWTGSGPFTHDDPRDRPGDVFGANVTLRTGPARQAYVMLPVIPAA